MRSLLSMRENTRSGKKNYGKGVKRKPAKPASRVKRVEELSWEEIEERAKAFSPELLRPNREDREKTRDA